MKACAACRRKFTERRQAAPCAECSHRPPRLFLQSLPAWRLWMAVCTQWRTGFGGLVGLDYSAMYRVAETLNVQITPQVLEKIQLLELDTLTDRKKAGDDD
ncbi:DUF1799 domain-containing protein [Nitratidesulfovibrio liaohensis]|uniref:DUF1799 domain-containing protein n=1 Tax=Nitratidesulfovibrio liaohensis TaxID=2604158 RepID=A0ABY9QZS0_9BACT|nr:DUF1799 domain-containing protein [Nitratidesulfovibrio liaohensis]WMW64392.1 DUF1799 domain-containing protein [Nitratidesulfovibrio liaohensis]